MNTIEFKRKEDESVKKKKTSVARKKTTKRVARKTAAKKATKKTAPKSKTLYVVDGKGRKTNLKLVATK